MTLRGDNGNSLSPLKYLYVITPMLCHSPSATVTAKCKYHSQRVTLITCNEMHTPHLRHAIVFQSFAGCYKFLMPFPAAFKQTPITITYLLREGGWS